MRDIVPLAKEINGINERLGVSKTRLFNTTVGGEAFGTSMLIFECESMQAWAEESAKRTADADFQALVPKVFGADAPWTTVSRSLVQEIAVD